MAGEDIVAQGIGLANLSIVAGITNTALKANKKNLELPRLRMKK